MLTTRENTYYNAAIRYLTNGYYNHEFRYCCGVYEASAAEFSRLLQGITEKELDNVIKNIAYRVTSTETIPNIVVFTTSSGENRPETIALISKYATSKNNLGVNKYSNFKLVLYVWDFVKIYKKLNKV